jgi:hypothetical protein
MQISIDRVKFLSIFLLILATIQYIRSVRLQRYRAEFISTAQTASLRPFEPSAIQAKCAANIWPKDVVLECPNHWGGVGNVRTSIIACFDTAIENQAGVIIPKISPRKPIDANETVVNEYEKPIALDLLFDVQETVARLRTACPQMAVYHSVEELSAEVKGDVESVGRADYGDLRGEAGSKWISTHRAAFGKISLVTLNRAFPIG